MNDTFSSPRGAGILFFDEDFDSPPPAPPSPEPEVIEPAFSAGELTQAREAAAHEARENALTEAAAASKAVAARALETIAAHLAAAGDEAAAIAEQSAEAILRLLLDCFATAFPALCEHHGPEEAAAVLRAVLPALHREPKITVRVNPHIAGHITGEIQNLDPDLAARIRLIPTDALTPDDVRIAWDHGTAVRDTKALWAQIENILAPAGLLTPPHKTREFEHVD